MSTRVEHFARYLYPGAFFPEDVSRSISEPTLAAAVAAGPDEDGYFSRDGWYAVEVMTRTSKLFVSDDGDETWVAQATETIERVVIGERIHYDDLPGDDEHRILRSNVRCNSKSGYAVKTRCGNWQMADDFTCVLEPSAVTR